MMKKGANVFGLIVILLIIGSAFVGVVTAEEIIIDTEITESRFMEYPSRPVIGWYYIFDHDTFHTKAYNDNFWYTLCGEKGHGDPFYGVWQASLPQSGDYEVFVWIPDPDPFVEVWPPHRTYTPTQSAAYQIYHKAGRTTKTVNQELRTGGFYSLGTFNFDTLASVILNDRTGESYLSTMIAFDAVKFVPVAAPNTPPYTPSNPSPTNHATGQSIYTDLGWTGGDPDAGDIVTYDVYFGTSTRPLKVSTAQSGTTYDPGTLSYSTYYWRIVATDNHGASTTGPLWDFTTGSVAVHDMAVTDVYTTPSSPNVGQSTTIHVTVKNEGSQQENDVPVKAYVDGYQVGSAQDVTLTDGKTTKSFTWTPSTAKTYSVKGEVGIVSGETDTSDNTKTISVSVQQQNLYWLAKAIMSEASVGTQEERIAVGWTVLNRLDSNEFPSTIKKVVESGYAYNQEPTQKIIDLSKDILERKYADPTGGATYFFSPRSMKSGYGPYKIPETNKVSYIPSWTIPKGYSKTSPPHSDWEMTEFYKTIENLEWVSGLEDIRIWYFMFYRPISDSQEELIHSPIQQERIVEKDVPVTIEGNQYIIATLRHKIDPETLRAIPDSGEVKVYLDTEGNPVSDEEIARKIGIIDYVRHLQAGGLEDELYEKYDDVNKKMLVLGTIPLAEWPIEAIETIPRIIKVSTERLIQELIEIVGKESVKHLLNTKEELRAEADMNFQSAWNEYFKACQVLRRNKEIVDYSTAYTVLENTLLGDFHEKMGSFICSKIYEPKMGKLFIREFAKVLTWGISEEALARIVHIDYIIESYYEGNIVQCQLSKEPYEPTSYTLELSQVSPTLSNEFNSCITEIEENTAKIYEDVADYLEMFSFKDYIRAIFKSPGELRVYDSQGWVTGLVNGEIKEKIPNSIYDNESKIVVIFTPDDSYRYEIVGTGEGAYGLEVTSVEDGNATIFTATDIPTTSAAVHQYTIDWNALSQGEKGVTVKIDSNGNGTFERIIITNNSFQPLIAEFTFSPENPIIGEKVTLDASTSFDLGGGVIKKYCWEFYNAANQDPFYVIEGHDKKIISYSFTSDGIYRVRLTVTDDEGEYSYTESSITIKEPIKEPVFYVPDDYPSIQAAVDAANAGDTIIVRDGTYTENVDIDKSITLKSSSGNPGNTIVQAANPNDHVFEITADHVNISGFTVTNANGIRNAGIYLYYVNHCNISNNICLNSQNGICLYSSVNNNIINNICSDNYDGIFILESNNNLLLNNTCLNNFDGVRLFGFNSNNDITSNRCLHNTIGICLEYSSENNTVNNNSAKLNTYGIYLDSNSNIIKENNCVGNNKGFWAYNSSRNVLINNNALNNNDGICLVYASNNNIYLNNFMNNICNINSSKSTNIWNSPKKITYTYNGNTYNNYLGNHWDEYKGTDLDGNGLGDIPYSINSDKDDYPLMTVSGRYFNPSPTIPTPPTSTLTPAPRPTLTPPRPTLTPTPRPTLRPTATLFEKIEGLTTAIRVGVGI